MLSQLTAKKPAYLVNDESSHPFNKPTQDRRLHLQGQQSYQLVVIHVLQGVPTMLSFLRDVGEDQYVDLFE